MMSFVRTMNNARVTVEVVGFEKRRKSRISVEDVVHGMIKMSHRWLLIQTLV